VNPTSGGGRAPPGCATALAVTTAVQTVIPVQWRVAGSAGRCRDGAGAQNTYCRLAANKSHARLLAAARRAPRASRAAVRSVDTRLRRIPKHRSTLGVPYVGLTSLTAALAGSNRTFTCNFDIAANKPGPCGDV